MREAELLENAPEADRGQINGEAFTENALQIHAAPAHHSVLLWIGASLNELPQFLFLLRRKFRGPPGRSGVDEPVRTSLIEAMHPVPQRLAVHAADTGRFGARHPVVNRRQCQQPPRLVSVPHLDRQAAQVIATKVLPKQNRCAHLHPRIIVTR
jgi:hypothetical protein